MSTQTHMTFVQSLHRYERELIDLKIAAVMAAIAAFLAALCMVTSTNDAAYLFGVMLCIMIGLEWLAIKWARQDEQKIKYIRHMLQFR